MNQQESDLIFFFWHFSLVFTTSYIKLVKNITYMPRKIGTFSIKKNENKIQPQLYIYEVNLLLRSSIVNNYILHSSSMNVAKGT